MVVAKHSRICACCLFHNIFIIVGFGNGIIEAYEIGNYNTAGGARKVPRSSRSFHGGAVIAIVPCIYRNIKDMTMGENSSEAPEIAAILV